MIMVPVAVTSSRKENLTRCMLSGDNRVSMSTRYSSFAIWHSFICLVKHTQGR